jgi:hypothetical protein
VVVGCWLLVVGWWLVVGGYCAFADFEVVKGINAFISNG